MIWRTSGPGDTSQLKQMPQTLMLNVFSREHCKINPSCFLCLFFFFFDVLPLKEDQGGRHQTQE